LSNIKWWAEIERRFAPEARAQLGKEGCLMHTKANVAAHSLGDESIETGLEKLIELTRVCNTVLDRDTAKPLPGKDDEYHQALLEMRTTAADIRRRGRELVEGI
jgi:hypothetical protein